METSVHKVAVEGFASSATARYDAGRPTYSSESASFIADLLAGSKPEETVEIVEVGAGTGKFTFALLDALRELNVAKKSGSKGAIKLLATDGVDGMVQKLVENAQKKGVLETERDGVTLLVRRAGAEDLTDVPDASVSGGIVIAQAFHWFATRAALAEFARVMRPGAHLVLVWNTRDDTVPWVKELEEYVDTLYSPGTPRQQSGQWKSAFSAEAGPALFAPLQHRALKHFQPAAQRGDIQVLVDRILSISEVATFSPERQAEVESTVRALAERHFGESASNVFEGIPYRCDVWWTTRL